MSIGFKRIFAPALSAVLLCMGLLNQAIAQPASPAKYTVAMVLPRDDQINVEAGFISYLERQNLAVRYLPVRFSGKAEDAAALRDRLRGLHPDLIYTWGTPTTLAVTGRHDQRGPETGIRDIPVVFTEVTDPVSSGVLATLERPGRNVTGVSHVAPLPVQINAIRMYRPLQKLGYLHNPAEPNSAIILERLKGLAASQGFEVIAVNLPLLGSGAPDPAQIPRLVREVAERKADFLYVGPITFLAYTHRDALTQAALEAHLPTFCATESIVRQSGCLFGLFSNGANIGRFAGSKAAQILAGQVPVEQIPAATLQRFSLLVNMRSVAALNLYPPLLLLNVAEVINVALPSGTAAAH